MKIDKNKLIEDYLRSIQLRDELEDVDEYLSKLCTVTTAHDRDVIPLRDVGYLLSTGSYDGVDVEIEL